MYMPEHMTSLHYNVPIFTIWSVFLSTIVYLFDFTYRQSIKHVVLIEELASMRQQQQTMVGDYDEEEGDDADSAIVKCQMLSKRVLQPQAEAIIDDDGE